MAPKLLPLAVATAAAVAAPSGYELYYGDAGLCDYDNAPPSCFSRQVPTMWLQKATLDANGITTSKVNLTDPDEGMGYIDVHPDGASVLFATERSNGDVETYILNLTSAGAAGQPAEFLSDISALVAPCKAVGCVDASTFHATWSYSGDEVFFAYRVWDQFGDGIGNQAIGKAARDGSGMTPLTFTTAGPDKGINIIDTCPAPVKGQTGQILFVRTEDQGASNYLAVADVTTGNVTLLTGLPQWAQASGCPNYVETADGLSVVYMACLNGGCDGPLAVRRQLLPVTRTRRGVDRAHAGMVTSSAQQGRKSGGDPHWAAWGMLPPSPDASTITKRVVAPNNTVLFAYFGVTMKAGSPTAWTAVQWFPVPLVNTQSYLDTYGVTQCDQIHGLSSANPITCQSGNMTVETFQTLFVDPSSGYSSVNSTDTLKLCMTPRCSFMRALN